MLSLVGVVTAVISLSVGAVASTTKELTKSASLALLSLSVTVTVQSE